MGVHFTQGGFHVPGIGVGHGLYGHGRAAADGDVSREYLFRGHG